MNIHNSMEDIVSKEVNHLYEQLKKDRITWLNCDCETCRLDTICYVLNRTMPKYSVSERGILHNKLDLDDNSQLKVDVTSLALEGIRLINNSHRAYHKGNNTEKKLEAKEGEFYYNFPLLIGAVHDGGTFEPLSDVSITLKCEDKIIEMYDSTWTNPAQTYKSTQGAYSFWPKPILAPSANDTKVFKLTFEVSAESYETTIYSVNLPLVPEDELKSTLDSSYSLKIKDIFLFHKGSGNPMDC